jgi:UDP-N-acetylglucosamine 4,6-dehydratase
MDLTFLKNKKILITGGTGSIGSALVFKLINSKCSVIRVMSNDENGLYELSKKINSSFTLNYNIFENEMKKNKLRFFLGDVRDFNRCKQVTQDADIVIHAAAVKHVAICEYNMNEAVQTNLKGTQNMLKASVINKVLKFIFISTDKVVSPTNIMGSSKLLAEKYVINSKKLLKNKKTKACCVRFGNVIGSRGSVVPNFINQLKNKKDIYVTDKKMTRFVMSLNQSVNLILSSVKKMQGGEIFILKSMNCLKIIDLANALKNYFNKINKSNCKVKFSKKMLGEKLNEELFTIKEMKYLKENKQSFIIRKNMNILNNKKFFSKFEKFRVSNFNFISEKKIISYMKKNNLI